MHWRTLVRRLAPLKGDCDLFHAGHTSCRSPWSETCAAEGRLRHMVRFSTRRTLDVRRHAPLPGDCDKQRVFLVKVVVLGRPKTCVAQRRLRLSNDFRNDRDGDVRRYARTSWQPSPRLPVSTRASVASIKSITAASRWHWISSSRFALPWSTGWC